MRKKKHVTERRKLHGGIHHGQAAPPRPGCLADPGAAADLFPGIPLLLDFLLSLPGLAHCHRHLDRRFPLFLLLLVPYQMEKAQLLPDKFYPICKYIFCPVCFLVLILGIVLGGIG